jgi:peptidoglycan/LPS O-acetylase OafA/YrhL
MTAPTSPPGYFSLATRPGAIPELDGLRGIAILLVLLRHSAKPIFDEHGSLLQLGPWDLATPLLNGWMGVDLFFVLSGFLITYHLLQHWPERMTSAFLLRYASRRVLRTFPAYYAMVFLIAAGLLPFYRPDVADLGGAVMRHLLFLQDYYGSEFMAAFWSLGVEEKFYLFCPAVLWWVLRYPSNRQLKTLLALAALPLLLRALTLASQDLDGAGYAAFFWTLRAPFHLALDGLWLGACCAILARARPSVLTNNAASRSRLLAFGCGLILLLIGSVAWFDAGYIRASVVVLLLVAVGFASIVLAVSTGPTPLSGLLSCRPLRFFAVTSYSIYLTHLAVVPIAESWLASLPLYRGGSALTQWLLLAPLFIVLSVAAGLLLHWLVEKPFLLLKERRLAMR